MNEGLKRILLASQVHVRSVVRRKGRTNLQWRGLALLVLISPTAAWADCFCLTNDDDAVWFDCVEQRRPLTVDPLLFCRDRQTGRLQRVEDGHLLDRIPEGEGFCQPCRIEIANEGGRYPRGEDAATPPAPAESNP